MSFMQVRYFDTRVFLNLLSLLLLLVSYNGYATNWCDLWLTRDQQANVLMQQGEFSKAQTLFQENAWRASAAFRAGNYSQAARDYEILHNELGYYNQGNALAHMGQYANAIKAYNKALSINSSNQDALYNKKLVMSLLKQEQEMEKKAQKDKSSNNKQDKNTQNNNNKNSQNDASLGKNQEKKRSDSANQAEKTEQDKNQIEDNTSSDNSKEHKIPQDHTKNNAHQSSDKEGKQQHEQLQAQTVDNKKNTSDDHQSNFHSKSGSSAEIQSAMEHEKQQAKEQWLRLVPDDPGGLLREKFLRDYLRRQHGWY